MVKVGAPPDASLEPAHLSLVAVTPKKEAWMVTAEANPTRRLLLLAQVPREVGRPLVLEVFQRPNMSSVTQRGYRRFVEQTSELLKDGLRRLDEQQLPRKRLIFKDHWFARWIAWLCRRLGVVDEGVGVY
jgi:hypothetical protein